MAAAEIEAGFFPSEVHGWALAPEVETYAADDLYKYIDGASELYISHGFRKLLTRRYERTGWPVITADLFDMGDSGGAFGIFAHSQENPDQEIGQDSEYLDGLLRFWQGQCYVSLLCSPETPESRTAVLELGRRIARLLPREGERPKVLALLPERGLIAPSVRYFRHHAWQNAYVFIASENILEIGPGCEALLARYDQGGQRPIVLLVLHPSLAAAEQACAALKRRFGVPAGGGAAIKLADNKYFIAGLEKTIVAAVWHGGGAAPARELLSVLLAKIIAFNK